jgi:hypothetical protein
LRLEAKGQFPSEEYQMKKPVSLYGDAEWCVGDEDGRGGTVCYAVH